MRISHFFIDRPIFAAVLSVVFVIVGAVSFARLPVAQYPEIAPPTVTITGQYPGASAETVARTVVSPIEDQINGVENMLYVYSNSTSDGRFTISVTFDLGTDLDIAQVQVQNRVQIAQPRLAVDVRNIGVIVAKASPDLMMVISLVSPKKTRDQLFISNYATLQIKDELARLNGVGSITVFGSRDYAMWVWLDPQRLQTLNLTGADVVAALQSQNVQVASGVQRAARQGSARLPDRGADTRAAQRSGGIREYRHQADAAGDRAAEGRRARRDQRPRLFDGVLSRPRSVGRHRDFPAARLERALDRGFHRGRDEADRGALPAGYGIRDSL